jgi:hypothetical protein
MALSSIPSKERKREGGREGERGRKKGREGGREEGRKISRSWCACCCRGNFISSSTHRESLEIYVCVLAYA